jgi:hypothetical protein
VILVNTQDEIVLQKVQIKNHPFKQGDRLCNLFVEYDCVSVNPDSKTIEVKIIKGYPKVYVLIKPPERPSIRDIFKRISPYLIMILFLTLLSWLFYSYHLHNFNARKL